jgi:Uncharacterised nucleotidyltransferase
VTATPALDAPDAVDRRVARFFRTQHARHAWPDVSAARFRAAQVELARVATAVLAEPGSGPVTLSAAAGARALGVAAFAAGVGPLIGYWCETGRVAAEPATAALFATHLDHGRRGVARLRRELERVLGPLRARGIPVWVLKGMHTAYAYFPDPGTRPSTDIDLLVHPDDWAAARDVLAGLGLVERRHASQPRDSAWAPPGPARVPTLDYAHADGPWSVDLHRSLDRLPFEGLETSIGMPDLATSPEWRELATPARVLPQPLLLAYLALHASSHFYRIRQVWLIELALVTRRDFAGYPERWEALRALVARTGSERFVFPALALARRLFPGAIDDRVLAGIAARSPRRLRRLVARMAPATAQRLHPYPALRERFVWLGSPRDVWAAARWLAWPSEDERPVAPGRALAAQWRRVRRAVGRMLLARVGR